MNTYLEEFKFLINSKSSLFLDRERSRLVRQYAWAIPNPEALNILAQHAPIVEMGAGTGYWALLLREMGVDIVAYDLAPPALIRNSFSRIQHTEVLPGSKEKLTQHSDRTLFLCWPPYSDSFAAECLEVFTGSKVIYIGEGDGGCTGDDRFHALLEQHFEQVQVVNIPKWFGIHDYLTVWHRR